MENTTTTTKIAPLLFQTESVEYSVSQISKEIQNMLEGQYKKVRIKGELSGVKLHTSGHLYYIVKDADSTLDGVCWRGSVSKLKVKPEDGLEVVITGKISTFAARSKYLIIAEQIEESGVGVLQRKFLELKERLEKEGFFDQKHKKTIPKLPGFIGIITSPTGAVIQDLAHRLKERYTQKVLLWPTLVQGDGSVDQIVSAINGFNAMENKPDVIIIARGGGSIEDLWSFNEEAVIKAIYNSAVPVISAVGHETDTTLCDFVADIRCPTPSAAGEIVASKKTDIHLYLQNRSAMALRIVASKIDNLTHKTESLRVHDPIKAQQQKVLKLDDCSVRLIRNLELMFHVKHQIIFNKTLSSNNLVLKLESLKKALDFYGLRFDQFLKQYFDRKEKLISGCGQMLEAYSFKKTLDRGFTLVRTESGNVITSSKDVLNFQSVCVMFKDGEAKVSPLK